mmetsp:Transcript_60820/g.144933  ORF Transcript_60820/g.144933 Transcript_60820/m.144933 type:complete len:526 (-) Transcript_60820:267-1844(-)|eukprot:CAMPEP_0178443448 /NCGR_PEP_ID=MMETSP0689_2-20121128/38904_1 /TAXON_ID=160604 /ORGANISM="Amphidinium massartii, Strain CS-259" /LENGTH=525 /DNA_ID=CAMNT_0020067463 /DNA_START=116 /DNA_END=1693 /DNA_ORIENTATION=+
MAADSTATAELQVQVRELEAELAAFKGREAKLEARVTQLEEALATLQPKSCWSRLRSCCARLRAAWAERPSLRTVCSRLVARLRAAFRRARLPLSLVALLWAGVWYRPHLSKRVRSGGLVLHSRDYGPRWSPSFHVARPAERSVIYRPIMVTIQEAFMAAGLNFTNPASFFHNETCELWHDVKWKAWRGITPILVVFSWHAPVNQKPPCKCGDCSMMGAWKDMAKRGAYIILYSTEGSHVVIEQGLPTAHTIGAKEVWCHTASVMWYSQLQANEHRIIRRFMPPGCAKALLLDVRKDAQTRRADLLGFLGNWEGRGKFQTLLNQSFGSKMVIQSKIWNDSGIQDWLETYPLQINIPAGWNQIVSLESPRMAQLVSNGACILSSRRDAQDERYWENTVHFFDWPIATPVPNRTAEQNRTSLEAGFQKFAENASAVLACQEDSQREFCRRFQPASLLNESGFLSVLTPPKSLAHAHITLGGRDVSAMIGWEERSSMVLIVAANFCGLLLGGTWCRYRSSGRLARNGV